MLRFTFYFHLDVLDVYLYTLTFYYWLKIDKHIVEMLITVNLMVFFPIFSDREAKVMFSQVFGWCNVEGVV